MVDLRILSFTNLPLPAVSAHIGEPAWHLQGWVEGLRVALKRIPGVQLGYASIGDREFSPFQIEESSYFCIKRPRLHRYVRAWYDQWQHDIQFDGALEQCIQIIDRFNPDIIHIHGTEGFYGLLKPLTNKPIIISIQGLLTACEKHFLRGYSIQDLIMEVFTKRFIRGIGILHQYWILQKAAQRELEIIRTNKNFIGRTDFDRDFINLINPASNYYFCQEVLRPEFYAARWNPEKLDNHTIFYVSGANSYKGLDCLLMAISILKERIPNINLRVGGPIAGSHIWPWISRKVNHHEISNRITWLGTVSGEKVISELEQASVFVHPSYIDNSPNSIAEAMLVGVPCIASYVGGIPSMIKHEDNGLLFPSGEPYSLAARIFQVLTNPSLASHLSNNGRKIAMARHDPIAIADRLMEIYQTVICQDQVK